jgi:hypothetical protein
VTVAGSFKSLGAAAFAGDLAIAGSLLSGSGSNAVAVLTVTVPASATPSATLSNLGAVHVGGLVTRTLPTCTYAPSPSPWAAPSTRLVLSAVEGLGASALFRGRSTVPALPSTGPGSSNTVRWATVDVDAACGVSAGTFASTAASSAFAQVFVANAATFAGVRGALASDRAAGTATLTLYAEVLATPEDLVDLPVDWMVVADRVLRDDSNLLPALPPWPTGGSNIPLTADGRLVAEYV